MSMGNIFIAKSLKTAIEKGERKDKEKYKTQQQQKMLYGREWEKV